jgi:predicted transcriptional regulator
MSEGVQRNTYVTLQALKEYLRREAAFIAGVKEGLAAAERGEFATDEEMEELFEEFCGPGTKTRGK